MLPALRSGALPAVRPRPALFRALGTSQVPATVEIDGESYNMATVFKHDSWAATALYTHHWLSPVVCKFNRQQSIGPIPMRWLGRWLGRREATILKRLRGVGNVPRWSGDVFVAGQKLPHAVSHIFIPGHPLRANEIVDRVFFTRLRNALRRIHRRNVAYVDLHKHENILVGDDGQPYLVDFQIGFAIPSWWPSNGFLLRTLLNILQRSDEYHLDKHARGHLPPGDSAKERWQPVAPPWWIRIHRSFAQPFRSLRRWLLVQLRIRDSSGRAASEYFAEDAIRGDRKAINLSCSPNSG